MGAYAVDTGSSFYRSRVTACDALSATEEAELARKWHQGDERAGDRLVESNLRHVLAIAYEYRRWGVALDDLVQQGSIGLLKAAQRFDPEQGLSLRTYAAYWIRAEIRDYVVRGYRIVRLGATRSERRALRAFRTTPVATVEELAARSGMPEARCRMLWPLLAHGDRSLDQPGTSGIAGRDLLRDGRPDPETLALAREREDLARQRIERAMAALSERERRIVWARLAVQEPETLEQIGKRLGVSRERVRQLESRARTKLREALVASEA
jgi:RNA polymerase sigma-32 factor